MKKLSEKSKKLIRRLLSFLVIFTLALAFIFSPAAPLIRSLAVMSIYSKVCENDSLLKDTGIRIEMPGGLTTPEKDWYPFVMTFNADEGFSWYTGKDVRLTILYNFGAFTDQGCSSLYDPDSPYYNSFYGAYVVQDKDHPYGFLSESNELSASQNGLPASQDVLPASQEGDPSTTLSIDTDAVALVPRYDFFYLVLGDFGLSEGDGTFQWTATDASPLSGKFEGWTRLTADLTVSSVAHERTGFVTSYLQYGSPNYPCSAAFQPVSMKGVIYAHYDAASNTSIFLYALCMNQETLEKTEENFLKTTLVTFP